MTLLLLQLFLQEGNGFLNRFVGNFSARVADRTGQLSQRESLADLASIFEIEFTIGSSSTTTSSASASKQRCNRR